MKKTSKLISLLLCVVLVVSMMTVAMVSTSAAANPYSEAAMALDTEYAYDGVLGAIYTPEATTFKVWAPLATEVKLNRFATGSDDEDGAKELGTIEMEKLMDGDSWTGVWTTTVGGDIVNTYYTYSITNPDHIYNSTSTVSHETQDPYSYAVGVNGNRSMVVDLSSDAANPDGWDQDSHVFTDEQTDAIVWEVHVKDFTYAENSGVSAANRGKFLGFTETGTTLDNEGVIATGIDYLKQLGVTHVQINPMYDFATINEAGSDNQFNWGYDPKNYGVPEGSYSSNPYDGNVRIKEAKAMIKALHDAGISVIMDVVYNHTYSVDSCFNYTVPEYYYRMTAGGGYSQQSGCGNDTASERAMYRKYMRDMLAYWTNEYHFDGYRFDLMGVHDGETMNLIREDMDEIDPRIVMYGEGWAGDTVYDPTTCAGTATFMATQGNTSKLSSRIGFFNDEVRDGLKGNVFHPEEGGFINGVMTSYTAVRHGVQANANSEEAGRWIAQTPEQCVTYASCHDNYTLYDKLVYVNEGSNADYRARYSEVIEQNKLAAAIINTSQGIDFLLAGEEMGRSKDGDENSYKSAATLNMIDWSLLKTNADLVSYYRGLFEIRKAFSPFTAKLNDAQDDSYRYFMEGKKNSTYVYLAYTVENNTEGEWNKVAVFYNGDYRSRTITLSADTSITTSTEWVIIANGQQAGVQKLGEVKGKRFSVPACSTIIAVEKSTFEECSIPSDFSKLTVNSVHKETGKVLASTVITGKPGEGYSVSPDGSIPIDYELVGVEGDETGVFAEEDKTVTYTYEDFKPESFDVFEVPNGDLNDDGVVDIIDVTVLQRFLANMVDLDEEHEKRGDYDLDGETDIPDVTTLQRYLARMIQPVCTITTRFLMVDDDGNLKAADPIPVRQRIRYGESYTTEPKKIAYYNLVSTPANASGIAKVSAYVDYIYEYAVNSPVMHVKHSGSETWDPYLWAWAYDQNGTAINCYSGWPGLQLTNPDENGWYDVKFPIPGGLNYYFIISNNGSPQTKDYGVVDGQNVGIVYDDYPEIWVVIDDDNIASADGDWCKYYNYNPDYEN